MGWPVDQNGKVLPGTNTSDLGSLQRINVSNVNGFAKDTTAIELAANLPSDNHVAPVGTKFYTDAKIYDSLGEGYTLTVTWEKTAVGQYSASMSCPAASSINKGSAGGASYTTSPMVVQFNSLGQPISFDGAATPPNICINWDPAQTNAAPSNISFDLGKVGTTNGLTSRAGTFNITKNSNDGEQYGNFNGVKIDENGVVSAFFDNGTNVPIYLLPMANFASPNQLSPESGDAFLENNASGKCILSFAKTAGFGKFASNALEASTVDLPKELTSLISIQRGYSANTHVIQTDSDMYKTLLQVHG